ncbi:L10-interacting MYB domain-containing-like protein isoform X1 [Cinnamomum micranthum f. kanehirae]|uniref:L10-interacting MYB domain-containing-like protein isoform X1 n=1 Tax=Cinnamomum micranthum f. kanehirae TaxID=337451 RepID=A0A443PJL8_9MAGN|nr:L10-interacting MYB domain-containing-like protein isoform X1 [Cinnamomum micranthum f. kanehirae]
MSEPSSSQATNKATSKNMKWTDAHDEVLLLIMLDMRKEGKFIPGGFTSEGWGLITKQMVTVHGPDFSKDKLKNRFKSYKKWYSAMKSMLNLSGFGWDEERKKVTAEEGVWDDYIAAHPGHSMYRTRHMPNYLLMCEIFGDSIADGREEFVTNDVPQSPPSVHADALGDNDMDVDDHGTPQNEEARDEHISSIRGRSAVTGGSSRQITRRQSTGDAMVAVVGRTADAVDAISRNTISTKNLQKEVWEALLPIDLEMRIKMKAFEQLGDEVKASQFLALDNDTRKIYVLGSLDLM